MPGIDRFSYLPNEMLTHLLSFMSIREAVQISTLSKRWTEPWRFLPVLKFSIEDWVNPDTDDEEELEEAENKLKMSVQAVLDRRGPIQLEEFVYRNIILQYRSQISFEFIARIASLEPQTVRIEVGRKNQIELPDPVFSFPSLEELVLSVNCEEECLIKPNAMKMPLLKILKLSGVRIRDEDDFLKKLTSGCPKLETIVFEDCHFEVSEISSNMFKRLTFDECSQSRRTKISCPNLVYLDIETSEKINFELEAMGYLEYANIHSEEDHGNLKVLDRLSNVSSLHLGLGGVYFKEKLEKEIWGCRTFDNLKVLQIDNWDANFRMDLLAGFLERSPSLENLTLRLFDFGLDGEEAEEDDAEEEAGQDDAEEEAQEVKRVLVQRKFLAKVRIIRPSTISPDLAEGLSNKLRNLIKNIGDIRVFCSESYPLFNP